MARKDNFNLTSTDFLAQKDGYIEVYSLTGERKNIYHGTKQSDAVMTLRPLKWYERLWLKIKSVKSLFGEMRIRFRIWIAEIKEKYFGTN